MKTKQTGAYRYPLQNTVELFSLVKCQHGMATEGSGLVQATTSQLLLSLRHCLAGHTSD